MRRSATDIAGNFVTKLLAYPLAFIAGVVADRLLGAHDRGVYAFLMLTGNFILPILTLGFGGAVIFLVSAGRYRPSEIAFTTLCVGVVQGLGAAALTVLLWRLDLFGETGKSTPLLALLCTCAAAPLQGAQLMASRILFGESRFGISNVLNLARAVVTPVLLIGFVLVVPDRLMGAVVALGVVNLGLTVATVMAVRPEELRVRIHREFLREAFSYGIKQWIGDVATRANLRLDQMILAVFASPAALGNYAVAVRLSEFLWVGADSVSPVLFNRLAASRSDEERVTLTDRAHRIGMASMVVLGLLAGCIGWFAIPWVFGASFGETAVLFAILLPGVVVMYTAKVLTKYFGAIARPELAGQVGLVAGISGLVGYFALIPLASSYGAALASSLSYAVMSLLSWRLYRKVVAPRTTRLLGFDRADIEWLRGALKRRPARD